MKEELTPKESLAIIQAMIGETKTKFENNSGWYTYWGVFSTIIPLIVYYMLFYLEVGEKAYLPYLGFAVAGIYQFFHIYFFEKKKKTTQNKISKLLATTWMIINVNVFIIAFLFASKFQLLLIPVIILFLGLGTIISSVIIRSKLLKMNGILMTISAWAVIFFNINYGWQLIYMSILSFVCLFLVGLILQFKKNV